MPRNYFIVKHDLESLQALPGFVWNSGRSKNDRPTGFRMIQKGDRWISFAYTAPDARAVSLVTGFYKCTQPVRYGKLSPRARAIAENASGAWLIKGESLGKPLSDPVVIPPLSRFVKRPMYAAKTITGITRQEFESIRDYTRSHQFNPKEIPCLGREPRSEQEVIAIIASCHKQLGIEKIIRIQTGFPDMLVKIKGKAEAVHLEVELNSISFLAHKHAQHVKARRFVGDKKPVGVLSWIADDKNGALTHHVHRVFELRTLLREGKTIRW